MSLKVVQKSETQIQAKAEDGPRLFLLSFMGLRQIISSKRAEERN